MATRLFNLAALASCAVLAAAVVLFGIANWVDPNRQFVSVGERCHLTVTSQELDRRLVAFNDAQLGPFLRGVIPGSQGTYPSVLFDRVPGVFVLSVGFFEVRHRFWTASVHLGYLATLSALLPAAWIIRRRRRSRRGFPVEGQPAAV